MVPAGAPGGVADGAGAARVRVAHARFEVVGRPVLACGSRELSADDLAPAAFRGVWIGELSGAAGVELCPRCAESVLGRGGVFTRERGGRR
ncbi:MAG: hypothetical protein BWX64_00292 [Acidobacteria bacterium ADurb.Bin051]|nr:MAG: hypothetical protein BWX64_00292 [Acidobacteria bacterium ADurb.Bin051]